MSYDVCEVTQFASDGPEMRAHTFLQIYYIPQ